MTKYDVGDQQMDIEGLELKIQKNHPDLCMIKRATWLNRDKYGLAGWMKKNYSDNEMKYLVNYITQKPIGGPPHEILVHNFIFWERRKRIRNIYRRYHDEIWHTVINKYYDKKDRNFIATLSKLECADQQIDSADAFEELLVRNALKITSKRILEERNSDSTIPVLSN